MGGGSGGPGPLSAPMGDPQAEGEAGAALATRSVVRRGPWCGERCLEGRRLHVPQWPELLEGQGWGVKHVSAEIGYLWFRSWLLLSDSAYFFLSFFSFIEV